MKIFVWGKQSLPVGVGSVHVRLCWGNCGRILESWEIVTVQLLRVAERLALHTGIPPGWGPSVALHSRTTAMALRRQQVPRRKWVIAYLAIFFQLGFCLAAWLVFVVRVFLHVDGAEALGLIDEGSLLQVSQKFPLSSEALADLRVVHFRVFLGHFSPLSPGPNHESIHWSLDFIHGVSSRRACSLGAGVRRTIRGHVPGHDRRHPMGRLMRGWLAGRLQLVFHHAVHAGQGKWSLVPE